MKDAIKREQSDACISSAEREHARPTVNVRDIFALRKQGKIEEAYEAIRPIYREHKGRFTTLCMFWTASDVFKLRLEQGRVDEAEKIYKAMLRIQPSVEDYEQADKREQTQPEAKKHSASKFMHYAEGRLIKASEKFRRRYFAVKRAIDKAEDATVPAGSATDSVLSGSAAEVGSPAATVPAVSPAGPALSGFPAEALSKGQHSVLDCIKSHPGLKVPGIEAETGIPAKSIERHVKALVSRGLIEHRGSKKTGGYHAL